MPRVPKAIPEASPCLSRARLFRAQPVSALRQSVNSRQSWRTHTDVCQGHLVSARACAALARIRQLRRIALCANCARVPPPLFNAAPCYWRALTREHSLNQKGSVHLYAEAASIGSSPEALMTMSTLVLPDWEPLLSMVFTSSVPSSTSPNCACMGGGECGE